MPLVTIPYSSTETVTIHPAKCVVVCAIRTVQSANIWEVQRYRSSCLLELGLQLCKGALSAEPLDRPQRVVMPLLREGRACICAEQMNCNQICMFCSMPPVGAASSRCCSGPSLVTMLIALCSSEIRRCTVQIVRTACCLLHPVWSWQLCGTGQIRVSAWAKLTCHLGDIVMPVTGLSHSALHTLVCHAAGQDEVPLLQAAQDVVHVGRREHVGGGLGQYDVV